MAQLPISRTKHVQEQPATVWTIKHGAPGYPVVDVYVEAYGSLQKIVPLEVRYVDNFTTEVHFSVPRAGFATVVL